MRNVNLLSNFAAIKLLLQHHLLVAMSLSGMLGAVTDVPGSVQLKPESVPLRRFSEESCMLYRSAIAFQLAPLLQLSALDIANQLMTCLPTTSQYTTGQICLDFSVEVVFPGWINFRLSDQGLATWLQHLSTEFKVVSSDDKQQNQSSENFFPIQYAHARCCSLLRLAHRQGLIQLSDVDFKTGGWRLVEPNPIPWLNDDQEADIRLMTLRLVHPAERNLIALLLDVGDEMGTQSQLHGVKLAKGLSNGFEKFYSSCRIWGEVKTETPKLAQARLGLVAVTQVLLRSLLQDQLSIPVPVEL